LLSRKTLTPSQWKRSEFLTHKRMDLDRTLTNSVCQCASSSGCESLRGEGKVHRVYLLRKSKKRQAIIKKWEEEYKENKELAEKWRRGTIWADMDKIWDPVCKKWYCEKCFYLLHPSSEKTSLDK
jgi:hypothetical protein